jgi:hypothetical protein
MTWALSLVAIIAMSDRTLLTSHDRCWIVGSLSEAPILALPSDNLRVSELLRQLG